MELLPYERPREKLRRHGAGFLTLTELIQLVVGSGSAAVSGAKLAKQVETIIRKQPVNYDVLIALSGLGNAKTCQLLAAIEIGYRLQAIQTEQPATALSQYQSYISEASKRPGVVHAVWFDGSKQEIAVTNHPVTKNEHYSVLVKRIFTEGLRIGARSVILINSLKKNTLVATESDLSFVQSLHDTAQLLGMTVIQVYAVHKLHSVVWSDQL